MKKIIYIFTLLSFSCTVVQAKWQVKDSITQANFINVHFWDADHGIISGQMQGRFLLTSNGGQNWDTITVPYLAPPGTDNLNDMQFVNSTIGFVCGGGSFTSLNSILMITRNAGHTWDSINVNYPGIYGFNGLDLRILNNKVQGVLFDYFTLFTTADSGHTLTKVNKPYTNFYIQDAVMPAEGVILMAGGNGAKMNEIYVSKDGGANWQPSYSDTMSIMALTMKGGACYAGCSNGWVLSTANAGNTWKKTKIAPDDVTINRVKFGGNDYPYLLGFKNDGSAGFVFGSDNNGSTWHTVLVDTATWFSDISMPATSTGYILSNRKLYKTANGGDLGLSVEDLSKDKDDICLYPNPATDWLHIELPAGTIFKEAVVYDGTGKKVCAVKARPEINMSSLAKGIYFIGVNTNKGTYKKKVLVK